MDLLTLADIELEWREIEAAVDRTCGIDRWCSAPDWVVPVHLGFAPGSELLLLSTGSATSPCYAFLARYPMTGGRTMLAGLEPLWGFACPVVAPDPKAMVEPLSHALASLAGWDVLALPGLPDPRRSGVAATSYTVQLARGLEPLGRVRLTTGITRQVADLSGGYEPWWARRSSRFRRNVRQAQQRAGDAGLKVVDASTEPDVFDRLLAVEQLSWKGQEQSGITSPEMTTMYQTMVDRLRQRRRLRVHLAQLDGHDVGYILGGVRGQRYRGLQISYAADVAGLSVGHLLQHHQISELCETGEAGAYDLGMDLDYKRRWADGAQPSFTLVVEPR